MVTWIPPWIVWWEWRYVCFSLLERSGMLRGYYDRAPRSGCIVSVGLWGDVVIPCAIMASINGVFFFSSFPLLHHQPLQIHHFRLVFVKPAGRKEVRLQE